MGDATKEIANTKANASGGNRGLWFSDCATFPAAALPWFSRGGHFDHGSIAGVFGFSRAYGAANSNNASRLVLAY